jgi:hydroxymethylbilane synthase
VLSFGTLASPLARAQTQQVISRLQAVQARLNCQMTIIPSPCLDEQKRQEPYLAVSRAEVEFMEQQLRNGEFRLMVQRAADLVLPLLEGLIYAAVLRRDTPYDALLNRKGLIADDLPEGARVGVLNLRTMAQMHALWPRLKIQLLRGGVDSALEILLRQAAVDALVIPAAAAEHLGIQSIVTEIFYPEMMLPSSGQGILAILAHKKDKEACELLQPLHSEATFQEMKAEQAFMQRFTSDQDLPVSALAQVDRNQIQVTGAIASVRGSSLSWATQEGAAAEAETIGAQLAEKLLLESDVVIDLLEADFPNGLPQSEGDASLEGDFLQELDAEAAAELTDDLMDDEFSETP